MEEDDEGVLFEAAEDVSDYMIQNVTFEESQNANIFFDRGRFDDECVSTASSVAQSMVEVNVRDVIFEYGDEMKNLKKSLHIDYLVIVLKNVSSAYEVLDASRSWIAYWVLHSLALLKFDITLGMKYTVINYFKSCQHKDGGFGGGPMQEPHLAPTYAAVMALCILGIDEAYETINRKGILKFLRKMKVGDGSFYMHEDGEIDLRSIYCAAAVYNLLKLQEYDMFENSLEWISRCQTYEGGFAGTPGMEAHGGYTFCGVASLYLLDSFDKCDVRSLKRWILNRQTSLEGGFQGRTNKLVDSCYSFWQYGCLVILNQSILNGNHPEENYPFNLLIDNERLQEYILMCCQHNSGGFVDKPTTPHDPYHTCYALSGLSLAQTDAQSQSDILKPEDKLVEIHPVYNLPMELYLKADSYFSEL